MKGGIENRLRALRKERGVSAAELADVAGVSRQTIHAIENGEFMPNTEAALKLAARLGVRVEELFSLRGERPRANEVFAPRVLGTARQGAPARLGRVREQWVSVPVTASPYYLPVADATFQANSGAGSAAAVRPLVDTAAVDQRLVLAGCDPAMGLLAAMAAEAGIELLPVATTSRQALAWLAEGAVHVAGAHLEDPATHEFNWPYLRETYPGVDHLVVNLAEWEIGFVVAPGNPRRIFAAEDLAQPGVRLLNREAGAGSRALLDRLLQKAGVAPGQVPGYDREARGHLAAAFAVASGHADCCVATRCAARAFELDFVGLQTERYDLVVRRAETTETVERLFALLREEPVRRRLDALAWYDTRRAGTVVRG